ncbi:MAG: ABC transporter ATP-binding protein [Ilumatobacter coccineus]|uniref:ABC transporter ATP-binding protein n=1 Tax=Ilumatobacter coccineus TaxID=467094 RepID=A0A2G6KFK1_9ACTN|nr:MAG: ABC transporter ATP-binding protein [Ilumatobacter coccineus]
MTLHADVGSRVGGFSLDVSFRVEPGETLALLGPNGSGKSTLLQAIAGLIPIERGRIRLDDLILDDPDQQIFVAPEHRPIGVVFQGYHLFDHLTALDNVAFGLRARGVAKAEARHQAAAHLDRVGLGDHTASRPRQLSGGQAQRVALARALAISPRLLLLDEPLAALDVATRRRVRHDLRHHLADVEGVRILITHDPLDVYALADRVAIIDAGQIIQTGTISEITSHPRSSYVADLVGTNLIEGTLTTDGLVTPSGCIVHVTGSLRGPAFAIIRPQSITLSAKPISTSARNVFSGPVIEIDRIGDRARVSLGGPLPLTAEVTIEALESLSLTPGDRIHAAVKATDIEISPR